MNCLNLSYGGLLNQYREEKMIPLLVITGALNISAAIWSNVEKGIYMPFDFEVTSWICVYLKLSPEQSYSLLERAAICEEDLQVISERDIDLQMASEQTDLTMRVSITPENTRRFYYNE